MNEEKKSSNAALKKITGSHLFPLIILEILMILIFTFWSNAVGAQFFKFSTLRNILQTLVISGFLAIGSGCLLIGGHIDLSESAVGALGGIVLASAILRIGLPWWLAIIVCLVICAIFGLINGLMVTKLRFPAFIATLAMASMVKGLMYIFSSIGNPAGTAANITFKNDAIKFIGTAKIAEIPFSVFILVLFFIVYGILMSKTSFGSKVSLLGGNPVAANLAGINATAITILLFVNSAVLGGVSGIFNTARLQQGSLTALTTNQFTGLTAAMLGGISFGGGTGGMLGVFIGLCILNTFQIGMSAVGLNTYLVQVFSGVLLLVALAFDFIQRRRSGRL